MRASSFDREPTDYDIEVTKRVEGWENESEELTAKIKGSSLKKYDKIVALNHLKNKLDIARREVENSTN